MHQQEVMKVVLRTKDDRVEIPIEEVLFDRDTAAEKQEELFKETSSGARDEFDLLNEVATSDERQRNQKQKVHDSLASTKNENETIVIKTQPDGKDDAAVSPFIMKTEETENVLPPETNASKNVTKMSQQQKSD